MVATAYFLSELVPQTGLMADYPPDGLGTGSTVAQVTDYSGNGKHMAATNDTPDSVNQPVSQNSLNGWPAVQHTGSEKLDSTGTFNAKHIFMLAKYDLAANFGGTYRGLISDNAGVTTLVGDNAASSTKFTDLSLSGYTYKKSQVTYAAANQQAPFSNFELLELLSTGGFSLTSLRVGQQTTNATRKWRGRWPDLKLYSAILTGNDLRKIRLYYDLKYLLWITANTTLEFPDPTLTGIKWRRFKHFAYDWSSVTDSIEFEDGGMTFNERTDTPSHEWEIGFQGLTKAQLQIFDTFANAARLSKTFSFIDKDGVSWSNVRIKAYESNHDDYKSWRNACNFRLCKYPA